MARPIAMASTTACDLRATPSCACSPAPTSRKRWSSSATVATGPDRARAMKKAAPAAQAQLGGQASAPMPPMVRYLDEDGELLIDQPMSDELALEGYRVMLRGRRFDERSVSLQRQGRMVTLAPGIGQEAATVGAAMALNPSTDWFVPQYRELAGQLWHGYPLRLAFLWHVCHPIAFRVPDGLKMLPFQAAIAGQLPQAAGLAWGLRLKGDPGVVLAIFGDGGTS